MPVSSFHGVDIYIIYIMGVCSTGVGCTPVIVTTVVIATNPSIVLCYGMEKAYAFIWCSVVNTMNGLPLTGRNSRYDPLVVVLPIVVGVVVLFVSLVIGCGYSRAVDAVNESQGEQSRLKRPVVGSKRVAVASC